MIFIINPMKFIFAIVGFVFNDYFANTKIIEDQTAGYIFLNTMGSSAIVEAIIRSAFRDMYKMVR